MQKNVSATANVASVRPRSELGPDHRGVQRDPGHPAAGQGNENLVNQLRDDVLPKSQVTTYVTGTTAATSTSASGSPAGSCG